MVQSGDITIKVGDGNTLDGGHISVFAGKSDAGGATGATGGSISIRSGFSTESSSGSIIIRTLNAGTLDVICRIDISKHIFMWTLRFIRSSRSSKI